MPSKAFPYLFLPAKWLKRRPFIRDETRWYRSAKRLPFPVSRSKDVPFNFHKMRSPGKRLSTGSIILIRSSRQSGRVPAYASIRIMCEPFHLSSSRSRQVLVWPRRVISFLPCTPHSKSKYVRRHCSRNDSTLVENNSPARGELLFTLRLTPYYFNHSLPTLHLFPFFLCVAFPPSFFLSSLIFQQRGVKDCLRGSRGVKSEIPNYYYLSGDVNQWRAVTRRWGHEILDRRI